MRALPETISCLLQTNLNLVPSYGLSTSDAWWIVVTQLFSGQAKRSDTYDPA